jgi:hypothetical protein
VLAVTPAPDTELDDDVKDVGVDNRRLFEISGVVGTPFSTLDMLIHFVDAMTATGMD